MSVIKFWEILKWEPISRISSLRLPITSKWWCSVLLCLKKWKKVFWGLSRLQEIFTERVWNLHWWRKTDSPWIGPILRLHQWGTEIFIQNKKFEKLTHLLDTLAFNQMIIFVNRVDRAKKLTELLRQKLFNPICIHSQLKQEERIKNYDLFKANGSRLLVATDLFGRGIDIERVNLVINYGKNLIMKISPQTEIPTCTEWVEQVVSEQKVWQLTLSVQRSRRTRREEQIRAFWWMFKTGSRWRSLSYQRSWILRYTCDLFGAMDFDFFKDGMEFRSSYLCKFAD